MKKFYFFRMFSFIFIFWCLSPNIFYELLNNNSNIQNITSPSSQNAVFLSNDILEFQITNPQNITTYTFWEKNYPQEKYIIQFPYFFEAIDINKDGAYSNDIDTKINQSFTNLSSFSTNFSSIIDDGASGIHFNLTSKNEYFQIKFCNHLFSNQDLTLEVIIENYSFVRPENDTLLIFNIQLSQIDENGEILATDLSVTNTSQQQVVKFGNNAFFDVDSYAYSNQGPRNVELSIDQNVSKNTISVAYEYFNRSIIHNHRIGIN